jgi:hypothetical protein
VYSQDENLSIIFFSRFLLCKGIFSQITLNRGGFPGDLIISKTARLLTRWRDGTGLHIRLVSNGIQLYAEHIRKYLIYMGKNVGMNPA